MTLTRLTPRFPSLFRDFDDLFRGLAVPVVQDYGGEEQLTPVADVAETAKTIEVSLDLPGIKPDAIDVKMEGNLLTISATRTSEGEEGKNWLRRERAWGQFVRSFTLPDSVDGTKPEATYKNGVLMVTLPKREEVQPKSVKVKVEA